MVNCHPHLDKIPKPDTLCLTVFAKLPGFYGPSSESFYQGQPGTFGSTQELAPR